MPPSKTPCARNRLYLLNHRSKVSYRCPQISQTMATAIVCTLPPDGKVLLLKMPLTYAIKHRELELEIQPLLTGVHGAGRYFATLSERRKVIITITQLQALYLATVMCLQNRLVC